MAEFKVDVVCYWHDDKFHSLIDQEELVKRSKKAQAKSEEEEAMEEDAKDEDDEDEEDGEGEGDEKED